MLVVRGKTSLALKAQSQLFIDFILTFVGTVKFSEDGHDYRFDTI